MIPTKNSAIIEAIREISNDFLFLSYSKEYLLIIFEQILSKDCIQVIKLICDIETISKHKLYVIG
jgi:hypothetical protein